MTKKIALTVIFEDTVTSEYADRVKAAIELFYGVLDVTDHEVTPDIYWAKENAKQEMRNKLREVLWSD